MPIDDSNRTVWQVAAGPWDRDYTEVFLQYGVALIGPGDPGPWRPERDDADFGSGIVRQFASEPRDGDPIILRTGSYTIRAVGLIAGDDYAYLEQFDDVNGWDLQHGRRVRWCQLPQPYEFETQVFGAIPRRFSAVWNEDVLDYVRRFLSSPPTDWQSACLPVLPDFEPSLGEIPEYLSELVSQVHDLAGLYWEPEAFGDMPSEHELVAHYVVPLLRCLGWPVERIAVEWRDMDVVVFCRLPRKLENIRYIVEAKRRNGGMEGAVRQARSYVEGLGVALDFVVTDGIRYRMHKADADYVPGPYANLANLKESSLDLFRQMRRP